MEQGIGRKLLNPLHYQLPKPPRDAGKRVKFFKNSLLLSLFSGNENMKIWTNQLILLDYVRTLSRLCPIPRRLVRPPGRVASGSGRYPRAYGRPPGEAGEAQ